MRLFDIVGIIFVGLWVAGVTAFALFGHHDGAGEAISLTEGAIELREDTVWMTVYRAGDEVGALREDRTRLIDGWLFEMQGIVQLDLADDTYAFRFVSRSTLNDDLTIRSATARVEAFGMTLNMNGQYREADGDPRFLIDVTLEESTRRFVADLDDRPRLSQHAIPQVLATEDLEVGDQFEHEFFDPLTLSPSKIRLEYEGPTEVAGYEGVHEDAHSFGQSVGNLHSRIRTDSEGMVLQQILPMQVAVSRMPDAIGQSHFVDFEEQFEESFDHAPPFVDAIDTEDLLALVSRFGAGEVDRLRETDADDVIDVIEDDKAPVDTREFYLSPLPDGDRVDLMSPRQHIAFQTVDEARVETAVDNPLWHAGDAPPNSSYEATIAPDGHRLVDILHTGLEDTAAAAIDDEMPIDTDKIAALRADICADDAVMPQSTGVDPWPSEPAAEPTSPTECLAIFADALAAHDLPPHFVHGAYYDGERFHARIWLAVYRDGHYLGEFDLLADDSSVGPRHVQFTIDDTYAPSRLDGFIDVVAPY